MNRIVLFTTTILTFLAAASPAAAAGGEANAYDFGGMALLAAAIAIGSAAALCGLGQGKAAAAACEGTARNPSAGGRIFTLALLGLAFIESLVIYALVVALMIVFKVDKLGVLAA